VLGHASGAEPRTAALKLYHPHVPLDSIDSELRALSLAEHAHVVQLRDLGRDGARRPVAVLERLEPGGLALLLSQRGELAAGEAVTILAPLASAVEALRASGVSHGAISAQRVLFRASGAPVLTGFGYATVGESSDADARALQALALTVLERVPSAAALRAWLGSLVAFPPSFAAQLGERVFELGTASPIRFAADAAESALVPARTAVGEPVILAEPVAPLPRWKVLVEPYLQRIPERFRAPKWIAVAAGALTLVIAIAVVPSGGGSATELEPSAAPTLAASGPVVEDDPVAAYAALAQAREGCIRDLSILCLDSVLQLDSTAMRDDLALIASIERGSGGDAWLGAGEPSLRERMGDVALLEFEGESEPAPDSLRSVLLIKTEAGWRIRSYVRN
jgi:eukaryotic-like serine/threonine-protein kinase